MDKQYTFEDLVDIVKTLRSEHGCPWDREQTHESLRPCMMEEAAELLAAIRIYNQTGNAENMQEELGDILLQAVMHSVIAEEEGLFTIDHVISGISEKMIRRHPHVFGDMKETDEGKLLQNWEEIKKQEKEGKEWIASPLREIPEELPSLTRAVKVTKKLDKLSQYHRENGESRIPDMQSLAENLQEQAGKIAELLDGKDKMDRTALETHMTGILQTICRIAYRAGLQPEQLLYDDIEAQIETVEGVE